MAQVTSYQRGTLTFTTTQQTNGTAQTVFTNSSASPMRVINAGCVSWNNSGNETGFALGFFVRHNGSSIYATTAMLAMIRNGNGGSGIEMPPGNMTSFNNGQQTTSNTTYAGPNSIAFGTAANADPLGANNTGNWLTSAGWWLLGGGGGRTFNTGSPDYFGTLMHVPAGFWMSPGDVLVCKAFNGAGSTGSNTCYAAYNFITITDSGS